MLQIPPESPYIFLSTCKLSIVFFRNQKNRNILNFLSEVLKYFILIRPVGAELFDEYGWLDGELLQI